MTQKLNEFGLQDVVMGPAETTATVSPAMGSYGDHDMEDGVEMSDVPAPPRRISIYAQSITPTAYGDDGSEMATFDLVLTVGVSEGDDGTSKTYQVVKRIAVNKEKIANEACSSTPVSVVEAKVETEKKPIKEALSTAQIFRKLAGLE